MELAIADNTYDPYDDKWTSEEARQKAIAGAVCPTPGAKTFDPYEPKS
jgi:hypothetical protein